MNSCFAYTRVSTVKQGEGVSLEAQRDAISSFAERQGITIVRWFEEKETAAKKGRPVFDSVVSSLQAGQASGLIVHKIDRSARNFSDWARIGELVDSGIDVHFAHESLDLRSRGGRLTADIQAVIAADYVRNLREESIKGMEGRLKQGLFPFAAPIGYLDQGKGKAKIPDPERAPFIRQAFELYVTERYSLRGLLVELNRRGFRSASGKPITKGRLETILKNPFYHGTIRIKSTGRLYPGIHEPIVDQRLFDRVQAIKGNRHHQKKTLHNHRYRRMIECGECGRSLYGERQKGHVYMRCQTAGCPTTSIREDRVQGEVSMRLMGLQLHPTDVQKLRCEMRAWLNERTDVADRQAISLQLSNIELRLEKLTDAMVDGLIDKEVFAERRNRLEAERNCFRQSLSEVGKISADKQHAEKFLELVSSLYLQHQMANDDQKQRIAKIAFSNRTLQGKTLYLQPQKWAADPLWAMGVLCGPPDRDTARTKLDIVEMLMEFGDCHRR